MNKELLKKYLEEIKEEEETKRHKPYKPDHMCPDCDNLACRQGGCQGRRYNILA